MNKEILIINNHLDTGGVEIILQAIVAFLAEKGERVTLWASNGNEQTSSMNSV